MTGNTLRQLAAAPHRMLMLGGALQLVIPMALWTWTLAAWSGFAVGAPQATVPLIQAHATLMVYGLFPFFFLGFLMTAFPRWQNAPAIGRAEYVPVFMLMVTGQILFFLGLFTALVLAALGMLVWLAGFGAGIVVIWRNNRCAPKHDRLYGRIVTIVLPIGFVGALLDLVSMLRGDAALWRASVHLGIWAFLVPIVVTVAHRMIPFFTANTFGEQTRFRPATGLVAMLALIGVHAVLEVAGQRAWLWAADLPLLALTLLHSTRWGLIRSLRVPLLAMLHVAFFNLSVALALSSVQSLSVWWDGDAVLGAAPLHAATIGFVAAMAIAFGTRVTLGHSGRALEAGVFYYAVFWGVIVAAAVRVLATVPGIGDPMPLNMLAGAAWLAAMTPWAARVVPIYLRPRIDGKPG